MCARNNLAVLLGNSYQLSHILHTANRLTDLTCDCNERLATIRELLSVFVEIGIFAMTWPRRWQLHQISDFIVEHLHDRAINESIVRASILIASLDKIFSGFQGKIDFNVAT